MRPEISEALAAEVDDRVRSEVRVPPDRITFADRLDILVEEYDEREDEVGALRDRVRELEAEVEELEEALTEAREQNRELQEMSGTTVNTTWNK